MIYRVVHIRAQREGIKLLDFVHGFAVTKSREWQILYPYKKIKSATPSSSLSGPH
jgi:hypothetical protein